MEINIEDSAHVSGEYLESASGKVKKIENRSNPWKIVIRSPKKWVLSRPDFNNNHPDIEDKRGANTSLRCEVSESFSVMEDAFNVQCNMYFRSKQTVTFNYNGVTGIGYEVILNYCNEDGAAKRLSKKNVAFLQNRNYLNSSMNANIQFINNSITRDSNDNIVVTAVLVMNV